MGTFLNKKYFFGLLLLLFETKSQVFAQTFTDAILMQKGQVCAAVMSGNDSWKNYWEGTLKRDNQNIGTITSTSVMPMVALGLTNKINVILAVPFIKNAASAGTLKAESGFQDFSLGLKYKPISKKIGLGIFDLIGMAAFSTPTHAYKADYLPLCLGLGAKQGTVRSIFQYKLNIGLLFGAQIGYTSRSNTKIDRNFYFVGDRPFYTNEVEMPDVIDYSATVGFLNKSLKINLLYAIMDTKSTSDIRRNDMPFISNNMDASRVSGLIQYYFPKNQKLSVLLMGGYTISGRNVGQATSIGGGIAYQFAVFGEKKTK
jgi:Putative MetA-pathway of phenol degradation